MAKYKGKTIEVWADKRNKKKIYDVGAIYETDDKERFEELLGNNSYGRPFLEEIIQVQQDLASLQKSELIDLLEDKGIEYNAKSNKAELVQLLEQAQ